jgi:shikimate kinase
MDRIKSSTNSDRKLAKRPLLNDMEKAKKLFDERISSYKDIADVTVNVENKSSEKIVKEILKQLR